MLKTLLSSSGVWKWLAITAAIFSLVAASTGLTYSKTKSYFIQQGEVNTAKVKEELFKVREEFSIYVSAQKMKVHALEVESAAQAQTAKAKIDSYKSQLNKAKSDYEKLLAERNETPGQLSTSAVDTINAKSYIDLHPRSGTDSLPDLPEDTRATHNP